MSVFLLATFAGFLALLLTLVLRSVFHVVEGHRAVLTSFGQAVRDDSHIRILGPGFHWKMPWHVVHDVKVLEQRLDLSGESGGTTALARDGTLLRFDSVLRFRLDDDGLERWLFQIQRPVDHTVGLFTSLLRNEIATFGPEPRSRDGNAALFEGSYAHMRRERRLLSNRVQSFCEDQIGKETGVRFSGVDLVDVLPPDELREALNAVTHAHAEAETSYARAEADCGRRVLAAAHGVEIAEMRAKAAETEIRELAIFLHELDQSGTLESYVARRRVEVLSQAKTLFLGSNP